MRSSNTNYGRLFLRKKIYIYDFHDITIHVTCLSPNAHSFPLLQSFLRMVPRFSFSLPQHIIYISVYSHTHSYIKATFSPAPLRLPRSNPPYTPAPQRPKPLPPAPSQQQAGQTMLIKESLSPPHVYNSSLTALPPIPRGSALPPPRASYIG